MPNFNVSVCMLLVYRDYLCETELRRPAPSCVSIVASFKYRSVCLYSGACLIRLQSCEIVVCFYATIHATIYGPVL